MIKSKIKETEILDSLFEDLSPELERKVAAKMIIAAKIENARKDLNLNKLTLAKKFKKSPSEITKWLSGDHNFTIDTLVDIEMKLNIKLLSLENISQIKQKKSTPVEHEEIQEIRLVHMPNIALKYFEARQMYFRYNDYKKNIETIKPDLSKIFDTPVLLHNLISHGRKEK
jgi:transcriptional regulator with XRE-family HTH domain